MANEKRLIDANRYAEVLERYINAPHVKVFGKYSDGMQIAISTCIELLNAQRTVDAVEVVHGQWIEDSIEFKRERPLRMYQCTECDGIVYHYKTNYCPNCGAKMDGDGNDI